LAPETFPDDEGLADQVKSLDWVARRARKKQAAPASVLAEVRAKLKALLVL
jgi:mRNA interferase MazF